MFKRTTGVEVTDGWWWTPTLLDHGLQKLVQKVVVVVVVVAGVGVAVVGVLQYLSIL